MVWCFVGSELLVNGHDGAYFNLENYYKHEPSDLLVLHHIYCHAISRFAHLHQFQNYCFGTGSYHGAHLEVFWFQICTHSVINRCWTDATIFNKRYSLMLSWSTSPLLFSTRVCFWLPNQRLTQVCVGVCVCAFQYSQSFQVYCMIPFPVDFYHLFAFSILCQKLLPILLYSLTISTCTFCPPPCTQQLCHGTTLDKCGFVQLKLILVTGSMQQILTLISPVSKVHHYDTTFLWPLGNFNFKTIDCIPIW